MKLLISLIILFAMLIPLVACDNQPGSVRASPNNDGELFTTNPSSSTNDIETRLSILEQRIELLEEKVLGLQHSLSPYSMYPVEDEISKLKNRVSELEDALGTKYPPSYNY